MHNLKRMFGQRVLPIVYDDSLSYYEMICKMMRTINEIIENNNLLEQYVGSYMPTFNGDWDVTKTYNPLSVVLYEDQLYIAKQEVPVGIAITAGDYWEEIDLPYFESIANLNSLDVLTPDQFEGTDTEKLTQAMTECSNGGTICINREYILDDDWEIDHLSSRQEHYVHILGIGKNAAINLNGHNIVGDQAAGEGYGSNSVGGIFWDNVEFCGDPAQNGFITDRLIRMLFTGCHFYGMDRAFYSHDSFEFNGSTREGIAQSYYFANCYFGCLKTHAFDVYRAFDCHFNNCIFEYDNSSVLVRHRIEGLFITNCLLENIRGNAIQIATTDGCWTAVIRDCYFEDNNISIDLASMNYKTSTIIDGCMVVISNSSYKFIHMPRNLHDPYGYSNTGTAQLIITNNCLYPSPNNNGTNALYFDLFHQDGSTWQYKLDGLIFDGNNFPMTDGNASMEQIYTLNYRPINKAYTKDNAIGFTSLFNSDGSETTAAPANKPIDASGTCYTIRTLKDTETGQDICVEDGVSVDPNTWYDIQGSATAFRIKAKKDGQGHFVVPIATLRERAGSKVISAVLDWKYTLATAPGKN